MKPRIKLASASTPDGGEMELIQHDQDFLIYVNGLSLMNSRQHESELELARLGCAHILKTGNEAPNVLIGGLGMGYTLRQTLDLFDADAKVVVSELMPAVAEWNKEHLGVLNQHPLKDKRTELIIGDIFQLLASATNTFDAILLDIDNGPRATTDSSNQQLYTSTGIQLCLNALRKNGCLAVWSSEPSKDFERLLISCGFQVRRYKVLAYQEARKNSLFIWVAAENAKILPAGGGELQEKQKNRTKNKRR